MIRFRQKNYSQDLLPSAIRGGLIGGMVGGGATNFIGDVIPVPGPIKGNSKFAKGYNKFHDIITTKEKRSALDKDGKIIKKYQTDRKGNMVEKPVMKDYYAHDDNKRKAVMTATGIIIGASLGALFAGVRGAIRKASNPSTLSPFAEVNRKLKNLGYKEGVDWTQDPEEANRLGTKVCIVMSGSGSGPRFLINVKNDPKLRRITDEFLKEIKKDDKTSITQTASDRFNEIKISELSNKETGNTGMIVKLAKKFITSGYPVYLIELS